MKNWLLEKDVFHSFESFISKTQVTADQILDFQTKPDAVIGEDQNGTAVIPVSQSRSEPVQLL